MRGSWRSAVGFAVVCVWLLTFTTVVRAEQVAASDCAGAPWMDPTKSPDERATLVIAQMTLDEKIQEMGSLRDAEHFRETPPIPRLCVPALRLNNGSAGVSTGGLPFLLLVITVRRFGRAAALPCSFGQVREGRAVVHGGTGVDGRRGCGRGRAAAVGGRVGVPGVRGCAGRVGGCPGAGDPWGGGSV